MRHQHNIYRLTVVLDCRRRFFGGCFSLRFYLNFCGGFFFYRLGCFYFNRFHPFGNGYLLARCQEPQQQDTNQHCTKILASWFYPPCSDTYYVESHRI
jgi:hypothetical protein